LATFASAAIGRSPYDNAGAFGWALNEHLAIKIDSPLVHGEKTAIDIG
jgi:hypothetical protein